MKIIKLCEKEHHINSTQNIQLGALEYYRSHEKLEIKDPSEGKWSKHVERPEPTAYSAEEFKKFGLGGGTATIITKTINIENEASNVYIFCTTKMESGVDQDLVIKQYCKDKGYNSSYEIKDPQKFAEKIQELLLRKLLELHPEKTALSIICCHREVRYVDKRETKFDNLSEVSPYTYEETLEMVFTKTKDFEKEKEYRFAWFVLDEKGIPFETKEYIRINAIPLRKFSN